MGLHLSKLHVEAFGCVKHATLELGRLHALIGPNDSGKTTLLEATRLLSVPVARCAPATRLVARFAGSGFGLRVAPRGGGAVLEWLAGPSSSDAPAWSLPWPGSPLPQESVVAISSGRHGETHEAGERFLVPRSRGRSLPPTMTEDVTATRDLHALHAFLEPGATLLRLDPDAMREPTPLLLPDAPVRFSSERGAGLAALLDALRDRGDDAYPGIERAFRELFPAVHRLQLHRVADNKKIVRVQLADGALVDATQMSEGMLYALGFLCVEHADSAYALLVEEPENGLHPARIADVMRVLRRISERMQVLLATHSPLVVNELEGAEVSVVTRTDEEGTKVTPLTATHNYAERARIYKSGELWLNYCDGKDEHELLHGPVRLSAQ